MKLFTSNILTLENAGSADGSKRFISYVIDLILLIIVSFLVSMPLNSAFLHGKTYKQQNAIVQEEIAYYNRYIEETHLVSFIDDEKTVRKDSEIMSLENLLRSIYHSYNSLGNNQQPDFIIKDGDDVTKYGEASLINDSIAYFYTQYIPAHPELDILDYGGLTPQQYLFKVYKDSFGNNSLMFVFDESDPNNLPTLNSQRAYYIYHYLYVDESDLVGKEGQKDYRSFQRAYSYMLETAEQLMVKAEPYYSMHYLNYRNSYASASRCLNYSIILSITIGYLLVIQLPKLLFMDDVTLGRKITGLGVITNNRKKIRVYQKIIHSILGIIGYLTIIPVLYLFSPYWGVYSTMTVPLIGNISLLMIVMIVLLLGAIDKTFILFTHNKVSLIEMILRTRVVDKNHPNDDDMDDEFEGKGN